MSGSSPLVNRASGTAAAVLVVLATVAVAACAGRQPGPAADTTVGGLAYELTGAGDPVVLIHAFSLDRRMWEPQVERLGQEYHLIRYDLRGHGQSPAFTGPYAGTEDLLEVLDHVGVRSATLVGLSAGAQIAVDFALSYPDRVDRLVLAGPGLSGYVPQGSWEWLAPVLAAARAGDPARAARLWAETVLMAMPDQPAADSLMRRMVADNARLWSYSTNPERPFVPPAIGRLSEIRVPTLILVGENDLPDIHRVAETLHAGIAGSTWRLVPDAGHLVNLSAPVAFTEAVAEFLRAGRS